MTDPIRVWSVDPLSMDAVRPELYRGAATRLG